MVFLPASSVQTPVVVSADVLSFAVEKKINGDVTFALLDERGKPVRPNELNEGPNAGEAAVVKLITLFVRLNDCAVESKPTRGVVLVGSVNAYQA